MKPLRIKVAPSNSYIRRTTKMAFTATLTLPSGRFIDFYGRTRAEAEQLALNWSQRAGLRNNPTETFAAARARLLRELGERGWRLSDRNLKVPHATSPSGYVRFWFRPQAIWASVSSRARPGWHEMGRAHSLWMDMRGLPVDKLLSETV